MIKKILLVVIVLVIVAVFFIPGLIIKGAVESFGSDLLQTEVKLKSAKLSILSGDLVLEGLEIANPEGFDAENALYIGIFDVKVDVSSLLSNEVRIKDIKLLNSAVTYEKTLSGDNLTSLKNKYGKSYKDKGESVKSSPESTGKSGKTVVIDHLLIDNIMVNTSIDIAGQKAKAAVPMPKIEMNDIGKNNTLTFAEAITDVLLQASDSFMKVLTTDQLNNVLKNTTGNVQKLIKDKIPSDLTDKIPTDLKDKIPGNLKNFLK